MYSGKSATDAYIVSNFACVFCGGTKLITFSHISAIGSPRQTFIMLHTNQRECSASNKVCGRRSMLIAFKCNCVLICIGCQVPTNCNRLLGQTRLHNTSRVPESQRYVAMLFISLWQALMFAMSISVAADLIPHIARR
jgi:hypothetical protein